MDKKKMQLGMNPSTASNRLVKDLLFEHAVKASPCYHCGEPMTRDDFSIEHIVPWLDGEDPVGLYFDLSNVAFSHKACNFAAARKPHKRWASERQRVRHRLREMRSSPVPENAVHGTYHTYNKYGCRCDSCRAARTQRYREKGY